MAQKPAPSVLSSCLVILAALGCLAFVAMFVADNTSPHPVARPTRKVATPRPKKSHPGKTHSPIPQQTPKPEPLPRRTPELYAEIDRYASEAPRSAEKDLHTLAAYLTRPAKTDREKARAIFRWIAERIAYDAPALFSKQYPDPDPEQTLRTHLAVCEGYARLYKALALEAGLTCELVTGHCKGYGYVDSLNESNSHAWNAVKLDGQWYLLDSTWGGGFLNEGKVYQRSFNDFYFLTPPEQLIYTHLPEDERWQGLPRPLDLEAFLNQPRLNGHFFQAGLELISPKQAEVTARTPFRVTLRGPQDLSVMGKLGNSPNSVLVSKKGDTFTLEVQPPAAGDYELQIFAGHGHNMLPGVLSMRVKALAGEGRLPEQFGTFEEHEAQLFVPRSGELSSAAKQHFELEIPGAREAFVTTGNGRIPLHQEGTRFSGDADLKPGEACVFAQFPAQTAYESLLRYQVR